MSERIPPHVGMYLHGDGSVAVVSGRIAAKLLTQVDLQKIRTKNRGADPEFDATLRALTIAGMKWAASVDGTDPRERTEITPKSEWMDPEEVGTVLKVSSSRVRQELRRGHLVGEKRGRAWRIHRTELEHYRAAQGARR